MIDNFSRFLYCVRNIVEFEIEKYLGSALFGNSFYTLRTKGEKELQTELINIDAFTRCIDPRTSSIEVGGINCQNDW